MKRISPWPIAGVGLVATLFLTSCGGGSGGGAAAPVTAPGTSIIVGTVESFEGGGVVRARVGGAVAGVRVYLRGTDRSTTTGTDGSFELNNVGPGDYKLCFALGTTDVAYPLTVLADMLITVGNVRIGEQGTVTADVIAAPIPQPEPVITTNPEQVTEVVQNDDARADRDGGTITDDRDGDTEDSGSKPDLSCFSLGVPPPRVVGVPGTVGVNIDNTSDFDAGPFSVDVFVDEVLIGSTVVPGQESGSGRLLWYNYTADSSGDHTVRAVVDSGNEVTESDESNNIRTETFDWSSAASPELPSADEISLKATEQIRLYFEGSPDLVLTRDEIMDLIDFYYGYDSLEWGTVGSRTGETFSEIWSKVAG